MELEICLSCKKRTFSVAKGYCRECGGLKPLKAAPDKDRQSPDGNERKSENGDASADGNSDNFDANGFFSFYSEPGPDDSSTENIHFEPETEDGVSETVEEKPDEASTESIHFEPEEVGDTSETVTANPEETFTGNFGFEQEEKGTSGSVETDPHKTNDNSSTSDPYIHASGKSTDSKETPPKNSVDARDVCKLYAQGEKIISVIGFANSGKSFFINRLRHDLQSRDCTCIPACEPLIDVTPNQIIHTKIIDRIKSTSTVLLDCSGEHFFKGFEKHTSKNQGAGLYVKGKLNMHINYKAVLACAHAYILLIPAELFFGSLPSKNREKIDNLIKFFDNLSNLISFFSDRLYKLGKPDENELMAMLQEDVLKEDLMKSMNSNRKPSKRPVRVAFSLADIFEKENPDLDYTSDPFLNVVKSGNSPLFNELQKNFKHFSFDFLSSFDGHTREVPIQGDPYSDSSQGKGFVPDYKQPSYGAIETYRSISDTLSPTSLRKLWNPIENVFSSRRIVKVRCFLDREFSRAVKSKR